MVKPISPPAFPASPTIRRSGPAQSGVARSWHDPFQSPRSCEFAGKFEIRVSGTATRPAAGPRSTVGHWLPGVPRAGRRAPLHAAGALTMPIARTATPCACPSLAIGPTPRPSRWPPNLAVRRCTIRTAARMLPRCAAKSWPVCLRSCRGRRFNRRAAANWCGRHCSNDRSRGPTRSGWMRGRRNIEADLYRGEDRPPLRRVFPVGPGRLCFLPHGARPDQMPRWLAAVRTAAASRALGRRAIPGGPPAPSRAEIDKTHWFPFARFRHDSHRAVACLECHHGADASTAASDLLLPTIEDCRKCHAPAVGCARTA